MIVATLCSSVSYCTVNHLVTLLAVPQPPAWSVLPLWIIPTSSSLPSLRIRLTATGPVWWISSHRKQRHVWLNPPFALSRAVSAQLRAKGETALWVCEYRMQERNIRTVTRFLFAPRCHLLSYYSLLSMCVSVQTRASPRRLPLRGIAMKDPRVPPMTLCGRRRGGFLKEPVYWCRKECMLWEVRGRPFLMKGSETQQNSDWHHTWFCDNKKGLCSCSPKYKTHYN